MEEYYTDLGKLDAVTEIMRLCWRISHDTKYIAAFDYAPHVNQITVEVSENGQDPPIYWQYTYTDKEFYGIPSLKEVLNYIKEFYRKEVVQNG